MNRKRILAVDDDPNFLEFIEDCLEDEAPDLYEVVTTLDGKTCLNYIESRDFDLLLIDLIMPGISGLDILKFNKNHSNIKSIIISGCGDAELVNQAKSISDYFIEKPFVPSDLHHTISKIL